MIDFTELETADIWSRVPKKTKDKIADFANEHKLSESKAVRWLVEKGLTSITKNAFELPADTNSLLTIWAEENSMAPQQAIEKILRERICND